MSLDVDKDKNKDKEKVEYHLIEKWLRIVTWIFPLKQRHWTETETWFVKTATATTTTPEDTILLAKVAASDGSAALLMQTCYLNKVKVYYRKVSFNVQVLVSRFAQICQRICAKQAGKSIKTTTW